MSLLTEIQALRRKLGGLEKRAKGNFGSVNRKTTGKKSEMVSPYTSKSKRKSPGRPTMTSMGAKKLKPRNTDTTKRPTRPSGPSMTSMGAKAPKPRNKNVTKRPTRPSKQGSFGRQMRASRGMGIIMPSKCCSKVLSRPSTVNTKRKTKCQTKKRS